MTRSARAAALVVLATAAAAPADDPPVSPSPDQKSAPKARRANRLALEKSPYLLQHSHNPVDWFPWGEDAFRKARDEKKPVFLSIGYSTCHWCHVMERESFENEEIAKILNESFVSIKVDREERPDIDDVYMTAVQAAWGQGGWPLSVFLTPEGKPFFGGTYFPPEDVAGRGHGFRPLLLNVARVWGERAADVAADAERLSKRLKERVEDPTSAAKEAPDTPRLSGSALKAGSDAFKDLYDSQEGGFGRAPKFPRTSTLDFLLAFSTIERNQDGRGTDLRGCVAGTLDAMARGGIRDHLGGGFHRYSTDREWTVPHFEKMLYDQALIARTYLNAGRAWKEKRYLRVAGEILDYVLARLTHPEGGFYSAEDADSEGVEGKYYVWTRAEVRAVLGDGDGALFEAYHGMTEAGNFEEAGHGQNVLTARVSFDGLAEERKAEPAEIERRLAAARTMLLEVRSERIPPALDDKVLTDWNGLAISAFAIAYQATGESRYLRAAQKAAGFIAGRLTKDGQLLHRFRDGQAGIAGYLEDYAFLTAGLLDLYEAGFDPAHLREAVRLAREMVRRFWDGERGGFFHTSPEHERLILRRKEFYDGAIPSGNSVAFFDLLRLVELTGDPDLAKKAAVLNGIAARLLSESPTQHPQLLVAAAFDLAKPRQVVVIAQIDDPIGREMVLEVQRGYQPALVVARASAEEVDSLKSLLPLLEGKAAGGRKATAYVCRGGACKLPAHDAATLARQLGE